MPTSYALGKLQNNVSKAGGLLEAGIEYIKELARSYPVTGPQPLSSLRRAGNRASRPGHRSLSGGGGKPSCPSPSAGDLRELARVPLRGEGSCGGGGAPRDSAAIAQSPGREAALAWASLAQRFPASSVLAREGIYRVQAIRTMQNDVP